MGSLLQNVRFGARLLVKQPAFTSMAVLVLALGIGATTAMFSLVNAMLFKPLLIANPQQIVGCYSRNVKRPDSYRAFSYPEYAELRAANTVFSNLMAHNLAMVGLSEGESTRRVFADMVSANYFATFGAPLYRGRTFTAEEERPGSAIPVVILSHSFWKKHGADPGMIGKTLRINGRVFTVVGITAAGFTGTTALLSPELYVPLGMHELLVNDFGGRNRPLAARDNHVLIVIGRLRDGLTRQAADAQLAATAAGMEKVNADDKEQTLVVRPLSRLSISTNPTTDDELRVPSLLLLFMAGIVLLIASLNVANMLLARGTVRRKEMAIRLAMGADRRSILSQVFTEGLLLAFLGGAAGLLVSFWSTRLLVGSLASLAPLDLVYSAGPDPRVLTATLGACLLSTLLFSFGPAWNLSRPTVTSELKDGETIEADGKVRRLWSRRNVLVIAQLSLSLMLLSAAGLFVRSSLRTARLAPGFNTENELIAEVDPSLAGYAPAQGAEVLRTLVARLRAMPGVESASLAATVPFGMVSLGRDVQRASDPLSDLQDPVKRKALLACTFNIVGTDYFRTMGIQMLRGRDFREGETAGDPSRRAPGVVILDRLAAERLFPNGPHGNALGQHVRLVADEASRPPQDAEVVGIVANVQEHIIGQGERPHVYVPFGQETQSDMSLHLRVAAAGPAAEAQLAAEVRRTIRAVDSRLPVLTLRSIRHHLEASFDVWVLRTAARMFTVFGVVALLLAAVGLYGVRAYTVARRTREIGIRMAVGASAGDTLRMVLSEGLWLTAIGSGLGLALSLALGQALAGMLYQVSVADPVVLISAPLLLAVVTTLASYVPARKAARIDPMVALRHE